MNIESVRDYCISKPGVTESFPFNESTLVFKTGNKIFLLTSLTQTHAFNVKCNPEKAITLREEFEDIKPGFHMNKKHWNTVLITGTLTDKHLLEMIDHSYDLVIKSLPKHIVQSIIK
jgi:predicted DNA-binding protein (MmcQ/YjbR family)